MHALPEGLQYSQVAASVGLRCARFNRTRASTQYAGVQLSVYEPRQ